MKKKGLWQLLLCMALLVVLATGHVQAQEMTVVPVNTPVTKVGTEKEADLYQVNLDTSGKFNVILQHANLFDTNVYFTVEVLAADLENVLQTFDSIGTDENLSGASLGLTAGTYYVKVYARKDCGHSYSNTPYTMIPQFTPSAQWEIEYNAMAKTGNDEQGGSTQMYSGTPAYGTINKSSDVDFFKFSVKDGGYVELQFSHPNVYSSENCWRVELVNAKTEAVCAIDSKGTKTSMSTPKIGISAGTYYIKVTKGSEHNSADYTIKANFKKAKNWEKEYSDSTKKNNNSMGTANVISAKKAVNGCLSDANDMDFYKVKIGSTKNVAIKLSHKYIATKRSYWTVTVYNSKLKQVCTFKSRGIDKNAVKRVNLKKGTYFVKVSCGKKWRKDNYKLTVG